MSDAPRDAGPTVYTCTPSPTFPGAWDDGGLQRPRRQKSFFFFFFFSDTVLDGEGKGGLLKWLMHCSLQLECLPPGSLFSVPSSHISRSCILLWVHNLFSEDKQGTSSGFSVLALVFAAPWRAARLVLRLGARKGQGWTENLRREGGRSEQM